MATALQILTIISLLLLIHSCQSQQSGCGTLMQGQRLPNAFASTSYYECSNDFLILVQCSNGMTYCTDKAECCKNSAGSSVDCSQHDDGTIFPIQGNCSGYVLCNNGTSEEGECAENRKFDVKIGVCSQETCN